MSRLGSRRTLLAGYALVLLVLVFSSTPKRIGDGAEYMAMADALHRFRPPALSQSDFGELRERYARIGAGYDAQIIEPMMKPDLRGDDGRQDFPHFWLYSALAAPWMWLTDLVDLNPGWAFTAVNLLLLLLAAAVVARRLSPAASALVLAGPVIWWLDKPHSEAFVVSLLAIGFALVRDRPWWALPAFGAAAAQYPPMAALIPLAAAAVAIERRELLRERRLWAGAAAGLALAALPSVYYLIHLGTLTSETNSVHRHLPSPTEALAPVFDLNVGLLPNFPPFVLVAALPIGALLAKRPRALLRPTLLLPWAAAGLFIASASQVANTNAGGTTGMSRYGLWFVPLAIPLLQEAEARLDRGLRPAAAGVAVLCAAWALVAFHPSTREDYLHPTWLARAAWEHAPSLENPLVEIFFERTAHSEEPPYPVATPSCSKVLVVDGQWPARCRPPGRPARCPSLYCYANRSGSGYDLVEAPYRP